MNQQINIDDLFKLIGQLYVQFSFSQNQLAETKEALAGYVEKEKKEKEQTSEQIDNTKEN